jgi:hypothetical protein
MASLPKRKRAAADSAETAGFVKLSQQLLDLGAIRVEVLYPISGLRLAWSNIPDNLPPALRIYLDAP